MVKERINTESREVAVPIPPPRGYREQAGSDAIPKEELKWDNSCEILRKQIQASVTWSAQGSMLSVDRACV